MSDLSKLTNAELKQAIRKYKEIVNNCATRPFAREAARAHIQDLIYEQTRRELIRMGWTASALIAGIAFFLGAAIAFLLH